MLQKLFSLMICYVLQVEGADCRDDQYPEIMSISLLARISICFTSLKYTLWQDQAGQLFESVDAVMSI